MPQVEVAPETSTKSKVLKHELLADTLILDFLEAHDPVQSPDVNSFSEAVLCYAKKFHPNKAKTLERLAPDVDYGCVESMKHCNALLLVAQRAQVRAEHKPGRYGIKCWQLR